MCCYYLSKHSGPASHLDHYKNNREAFEWWGVAGGVGGGGGGGGGEAGGGGGGGGGFTFGSQVLSLH